MMIFVDTAEFESVRFAAIGAGKVFEKTYTVGRQQSHRTLALFDKFLRSAKVKRADIAALYVVSGPGSFNGIRTGVSMCMALSYAWGIPLYAVERGNVPADLRGLAKSKKKKVSSASVVLDYGAEPNVTPPKRF
jgi:tRNA A37 threonylcarbamoyladenosine modification protein TsaB